MKLTAETTLKGIAIAMGAIAALMAMIELQRAFEEDAEQPTGAIVVDDPLRETLQRCRTLTPEQLEADTECQSAWAENRRRYFGVPPKNTDTE